MAHKVCLCGLQGLCGLQTPLHGSVNFYGPSVEPRFRVPTDPGKVWKFLKFNVEIFKALKSRENDHRYGKVWKNR